ncbi:carbohydrate porin [Psychrilyobacter atlanticus]|uniref:carbohydrate porin n=1 Tax=Psychrilyobacter atlanticus TaxID=271091 RepID=UPI0003F4F3F6|nr:carbohydrate porin [Psychrilyobacter atlanticus]
MKRLGFGIMALLLAGTVTMAAETTTATPVASITMEDLDKRVEEKVENMLAKNDSFEIHGYARAGVLMNQDGKQVTGGMFNDGTPSKNLVGRLGNETDNYWELEFVKKFTADNGVWSNWHLMFAQHDQNRERLNEGNGSEDVAVRQLYAEMGGFAWNPDLTYWVGKRFYNRQDIHVTDYYWNDYSGTGAGIQGLADGNLDLAYVAGSSWQDDLLTGNGKLMSHNLIATYRHNNWTFDGMAMFADGNADYLNETKSNDIDYAENGFQTTVTYNNSGFYGMENGFSKAFFQAGYGLGSASGLGHTQWNWETKQKDTSYRVGTFGVTEGEKWSFMPQTVLQYDVSDASSDDNKLTASAVIRPVYKVVDNFSVQFELGLGYEGYNKNENTSGDKRNGMYYKATVAPTISLNDSFWGRPQLRVFGSYVGWTSDVAPDTKTVAGSDSELRAGVQAEIWF